MKIISCIERTCTSYSAKTEQKHFIKFYTTIISRTYIFCLLQSTELHFVLCFVASSISHRGEPGKDKSKVEGADDHFFFFFFLIFLNLHSIFISKFKNQASTCLAPSNGKATQQVNERWMVQKLLQTSDFEKTGSSNLCFRAAKFEAKSGPPTLTTYLFVTLQLSPNIHTH